METEIEQLERLIRDEKDTVEKLIIVRDRANEGIGYAQNEIAHYQKRIEELKSTKTDHNHE